MRLPQLLRRSHPRLCPPPSYALLHQCRLSMNDQMEQYALCADLERRFVPQLIQLVLSRRSQNSSVELEYRPTKHSSSVLFPNDCPEPRTGVLLDFPAPSSRGSTTSGKPENRRSRKEANPIVLHASRAPLNRSKSPKYPAVSGMATFRVSTLPGKRPNRTL